MLSMLKQKFMALVLACFVVTSLAGCGQEAPTTNSNVIVPPVSSSETDSPKTREIPIIKEYLPDVEDKKIVITSPTGKINYKLQKRILAREIVEIKDGDCLDLNNDNVGEIIHFEFGLPDDDYWDKCTLSVGYQCVESEDINLTGKVYAAMLSGEWNGIQLLIDGHGPSADPFSKIFFYANNRLGNIGEVYCYATSIMISTDGFSGYKRGKVIQTWYRPADYIITSVVTQSENEENYILPRIVEVPRDIYPMGTIVKLKCDLPLQVSRTNNETAVIIKAGLNAILVATDDVEWLYVSPQKDTTDFSGGGWIHIKLNTYNTCLIDAREISADDIFEGLYIAD